MMERTVPWWRRALKFALSGFRSGFGLFVRNGRNEAGLPPQQAKSGLDGDPGLEGSAEPELPTSKIENQEEDTELKHSFPHSEEVAAEIEQAAEVTTTATALPAAEAVVVEAVTAAEEPVDEVVQTETGAEQQAIDVVAAEELIEPVEAVVDVAAVEGPAEPEVTVTVTEVPAGVEVQPAEVLAEAAPCDEPIAEVVVAEAPPESDTAQAEETIAEARSPAETSLPAEQDSPLAPVAETEPAPTVDLAPIEEMAARETPLALPFVPQPAQAKTTAEKVAAALKARGHDAEQSPFSVIVSEVYDGPLDLLLDLIRKQDIDIYDIPIAKITAQFLAYVDQLKASDMDVAGEFIYTAALLIHIKSKLLLPRAPAGPEDAAEDPRRELVERLLEHERFKNAAQMLKEKQMVESATWTNPGAREFREDEGAESEGGPEIAADTVDLVRVFRDILERARNRPVINVEEDTVTVGQMIQFLARRLTMEDKPVALRRLLSHTRSERALIAMFLALLELVRLQAILLRQDRHFSEIFIKKHTGFDAAMNQGLANARDDWR